METINDADYIEVCVALLANTFAQAKSLLNSLEQAAKGVGLYVNSDKTEFMYFNQDVPSTLKWQASEINRSVHIPW